MDKNDRPTMKASSSGKVTYLTGENAGQSFDQNHARKIHEAFEQGIQLEMEQMERDGRSLPSAKLQAISLKDAAKSWVSEGFKLVSRKERNRRWDICQDCDRLEDNRCLECGCYMRLKTKLAGQVCPLNKWDN